MAPLRGTHTTSWTATYVFQWIAYAIVWISQNPLIVLQPCFYIPVCDAFSVFTFYLVEKGRALCRDRLSENDASSLSEFRNGRTKNSFIPSDCKRQDEGAKSALAKGDSALESDSAKPAERSSQVHIRSFDFRNKLSLSGIQDIVTLLGDLRSKKTNIVAGKDDAGDISKGLNFSSSWDADKVGTSSKEGIRSRFGEGDTNLHVPWTGKETMKIPKEHDWVVAQEESLTVKMSSFESVIVGLPTREPSDTGSTQNKTNNSRKNGNQTPPGGGRPTPQVEGHYGSISYSGNSSGGDDGDGDDNRKQNGRIGGCLGNDSNDVDNKDKSEQVPKEQCLEYGVDKNGDDSGGSEEFSGETQRTDDSQGDGAQSGPQPSSSHSSVPCGSFESFTLKNGKSSCPNSPKKAAHLGLQIDVGAAKMEVQAHFTRDETQAESEEICESESVKDLQGAFTCRRNFNSDRGWQKCTDAFCQLIQYLLFHSQNCKMRVLGGCEDCIRYKDILINHVSNCTLPLGQCVVARCDYIREHMRTIENPLPGNRKWTWALDRLFFRSTPPTTPTIEDSEGFIDGYKEVLAGLAQARTQEDTVHDTHKDILVADGSSVSNGELSRGADGWNQYHVDRPPDDQVTRGPVIQESVHLECKEYSASAPLSAADVSVKNACASQIVRGVVVEEQGEIIWPLNQEKLGVGENGSYIENIHWQVINSIGGGSCGRCYLCRDVFSQSFIAIKKIPINKFESNEIEIWGGLSGRHPNILELYGAIKCTRSGTVIIFMEYMNGGSVEECAGVMKCNEIWALHVLGKVLSAVEFMHSQGILHRDIKGGNVLSDASGHHVKLADFGTSVRSDSFLKDNIPRGTEPFMSPEVCRSEVHSFSTDIWSCMCLLYQLLTGSPPWMDSCHGSLIYKIGTATEPPSSPPCSPEVEDLFSQGFILKPARRKTARELLRHPAIMAAPNASGLPLPSWVDIEEYSDGAFSSSSSSTGALESTASETSDQPLSDDHALDLEGANGNYSDCHDYDSEDDSVSQGDTDLEDADDFHLDAAIFLPQGAWQGADLSAEEQFRSLQSDLVLSLSAEDLERHVLSNVMNGVSENDVNRLRDDNVDVSQFGLDNLDIQSIDNLPSSSALPVTDWSYSITDLAKIDIKDSTGNLLFTIRERPTTAYGRLAEDLHGNIASLLNLDSFSFTREDGAPLNVRAEIGPEEQTLRVVRAHDNDHWQEYRWRVDDRGRVEEFFDLSNN